MKQRLMIVIICLCLVVALVGCKQKASAKDLEAALSTTLNNSAEVFPGEEVPNFLHYVEQNSTFEVESFEESNDLVTAHIKVTSPDLYTAVKNVSSNSAVADEQQADAFIVEELKNLPKTEKTIVMEFTYTNSEYRPVLTDEFLDAYYGGAFRLRNEMISAGVNDR